MFKLVAFLALIAVATARPGFLGHHHYESPIVYESAPLLHHEYLHEPIVAKVGAVVHSVPSAVSHQSQTIVHSKPIITPILAPTFHHTPIIKSFESPLIYGLDHYHHHHHF